MATAKPTTQVQNLAYSRYTDVCDEPVESRLAPISGYQDMPLVTLEESIEPISHLFDKIKDIVQTAKENCKAPADGLSQDESASIYLYTMQFDSGHSLYQVLNENLRSENRQLLKPWFSYLKLFLTALYKLPSLRLTVWRGVRNVDLSSKYPAGTKFPLILFRINTDYV